MPGTAHQELLEKVKALRGVTQRPSKLWQGKDSFFVKDEEFLQASAHDHAYLKLNKTAKEKLSSALRAESRASVDPKFPEWIKLEFADSLDLEFVFIYVRYVWKFLHSEHS